MAEQPIRRHELAAGRDQTTTDLHARLADVVIPFRISPHDGLPDLATIGLAQGVHLPAVCREILKFGRLKVQKRADGPNQIESRRASPGPIERAAQEDFRDLINRISGQGQRKAILDYFKARFCAAASVVLHLIGFFLNLCG